MQLLFVRDGDSSKACSSGVTSTSPVKLRGNLTATISTSIGGVGSANGERRAAVAHSGARFARGATIGATPRLWSFRMPSRSILLPKEGSI